MVHFFLLMMKLKPFLRYLLDLGKGILWWILVDLDNRARHLLGYSLAIRARGNPKPPSYHENVRVKIAATSLTIIDNKSARNKKATRLNGNWLYFPFYDNYNIAICLRELLAIRQNLAKIGLAPPDCRLIHSPLAAGRFRSVLLSLFKYFADHKNQAQLTGYYDVEHLIRLRGDKRFWPLWDDKENIAAFREELLGIHGIKPSPPTTRVNSILFIRRQNPPVNANDRGKRKLILRKISNEEELIEGLRNRFPDARIEAMQLEQLPLAQQLEIINHTDILIGMHGAGLIYSLLAKPNSGLIEIFPCHFSYPHTFYTFYAIAAARSLYYARFTQMLPWRETASEAFNRVKRKDPAYLYSSQPYFYTGMLGDYSYIPPQAIIKRVARLIKKINGAARP